MHTPVKTGLPTSGIRAPTRCLTELVEHMEHVDELGGASVPFWFDVHAMVFSDNAPAIEVTLHERFAAGRLNKVNGRKAFFRANISEIDSVRGTDRAC